MGWRVFRRTRKARFHIGRLPPRHVTRKADRMSLADDLHLTAVTAATHALAAHFPDVSTDRLQKAAEAAVRAARPFLDGTEPRRLSEAERVQLVAIAAHVGGGTVTT